MPMLAQTVLERSSASPARPSWRIDAAVCGAVILLLVAPFFIFDTIPLYDLPNHIARQYLLFGQAPPGIDSYYQAHWRLIPNLAMEGTVALLHTVVSIDLG